jgi:hypothetical protein
MPSLNRELYFLPNLGINVIGQIVRQASPPGAESNSLHKKRPSG